jgi:calcium-dependent protein kinase
MARNIIKQIINAIEVCHQKGIIHRDLKLENVMFLDKNKTTIKVVDFGISGKCKGNSSEKNNAGTILYMAPEVFCDHETYASPA